MSGVLHLPTGDVQINVWDNDKASEPNHPDKLVSVLCGKRWVKLGALWSKEYEASPVDAQPSKVGGGEVSSPSPTSPYLTVYGQKVMESRVKGK